jgi:hypothetical protein
MASARVIPAIRDAVVIATIVGALFVAIEGSVRAFWPQHLRTEYVGGASTAVPDDQLGHRLRPHARSRVSGPEFAVEYVHNGEGLRDEARHALPKQEGMTRILVLGDSFATARPTTTKRAGRSCSSADCWRTVTPSMSSRRAFPATTPEPKRSISSGSSPTTTPTSCC